MFIQLGDRRLNIAHIISYGPAEAESPPRNSWVQTCENIYYNMETTKQIDALINEACRRQTGHDAVISKAELAAV